MTTKKFQVRTNLQGLEDVTFTCDNRADAIAYITNTLMGNSQINPQDLILEEVEVVDEEAVVMETANKIAKALELFGNRYEIKPFFSHGSGFVELRKKATSFDISNIVLGRIFATVDEVNAELPEGYEVWFTVSDNLKITLYMRNR